MDERSSPSAGRAAASGCPPKQGGPPESAAAGEAESAAGAATRRPDRIKKRSDFLAAARAASSAAPGFVLQARRRPSAHPAEPSAIRLGLTASKKVGGAVVRSRAKRRLRALGDEILAARGRAGWDYVLVARAGATVSRDFARMRGELVDAVGKVHDGPAAPPSRRRRGRSGKAGERRE